MSETYTPSSGSLCTNTSQDSRSISKYTGMPVSAYARGFSWRSRLSVSLSYVVTSTTMTTWSGSAHSPWPAKLPSGARAPSGLACPLRYASILRPRSGYSHSSGRCCMHCFMTQRTISSWSPSGTALIPSLPWMNSMRMPSRSAEAAMRSNSSASICGRFSVTVTGLLRPPGQRRETPKFRRVLPRYDTSENPRPAAAGGGERSVRMAGGPVLAGGDEGGQDVVVEAVGLGA